MEHRVITQITICAARQHGLISRTQLTELGVTRQQLRTLIARGWLQEMATSIYGISGAPASVDRKLTLGLMCLGPAALVSHEAAARLHGFDRCLANAVEFTVPRARRNVGIPFTVHSTKHLPAIDRVSVAGYRCTSATRTIIDLARARIPTLRLEAAIDSAVRSQASSPLVLFQRLAELRGPGRWGARRLDDLLMDSGGHTLLERRFLQLMRIAGLPRPRTQVVHRRDGRTFARVDFLFAEHAIVVEVSGRRGRMHSAATSFRTSGAGSSSTPTSR